MQSAVPELTDISDEPAHILDMYGPEVHKPGTYARNCLLARRLVERDVRFVQLYHMGWDQHGDLPANIAKQCQDTDQPSAGLDSGPKTTRAVEGYAGHLGRRIWPDRLFPRVSDRHELRPRPSSAVFYDLAGGRRNQFWE